MLPGLKVVRHPQWSHGNEDCGRGCLGTVTSVSDGGETVTVHWDCSGKALKLIKQGDGRFDVLVYDSGPAGIRHVGTSCCNCKKTDIGGFVWRCRVCSNLTLCNYCYFNGADAAYHNSTTCDKNKREFLRFDFPFSAGVVVPQRRPDVIAYGFIQGCIVQAGPHWLGNENGGQYETGSVLQVYEYRDGCSRAEAQVQWKNGNTGVYSIGKAGKLALKLLRNIKIGQYHEGSLPQLGSFGYDRFEEPMHSYYTSYRSHFPLALRTYDIVRISPDVSVDDFQKIQRLTKGTWRNADEMLDLLGKPGFVRGGEDVTGNIKVQYETFVGSFSINPRLLTLCQRAHEAFLPFEQKSDKTIELYNDVKLVGLQTMQRVHKRHNLPITEEDLSKCAGQRAIIRLLGSDGCVTAIVRSNNHLVTTHFECVAGLIAPAKLEKTLAESEKGHMREQSQSSASSSVQEMPAGSYVSSARSQVAPSRTVVAFDQKMPVPRDHLAFASTSTFGSSIVNAPAQSNSAVVRPATPGLSSASGSVALSALESLSTASQYSSSFASVASMPSQASARATTPLLLSFDDPVATASSSIPATSALFVAHSTTLAQLTQVVSTMHSVGVPTQMAQGQLSSHSMQHLSTVAVDYAQLQQQALATLSSQMQNMAIASQQGVPPGYGHYGPNFPPPMNYGLQYPYPGYLPQPYGFPHPQGPPMQMGYVPGVYPPLHPQWNAQLPPSFWNSHNPAEPQPVVTLPPDDFEQLDSANGVGIEELSEEAYLKILEQFKVAIVRGQLSVVEELEKKYPDLVLDPQNLLPPDGDSHLSVAIANGQSGILKWLLEKLGSLEGFEPQALLQQAVEQNSLEMVELLVDYVDVNAVNKQGETVLHIVAAKEMVFFEMAKCLLSHGADATKPNKDNLNAVHIAAICGSNLLIKELSIEKPGIIMRSDHTSDGFSALHHAVKHGRRYVCERLIECIQRSKQSVDVRSAGTNLTALHVAVQSANVDLITLLLDHKADIQAKDPYGNTPLHLAILNDVRNCEMVELLVSRGADVNAKNAEGNVPMHLADQLLRQHFADVRGQAALVNVTSNTAPMSDVLIRDCCGGRTLAIVCFLMLHTATFEALNDDKQMALDLGKYDEDFKAVFKKLYQLGHGAREPCALCWSKPPRVRFLPCRHLIVCECCSHKAKENCFRCSMKIEKRVDIFSKSIFVDIAAAAAESSARAECDICLTTTKNWRFDPCGHMSCKECYETMPKKASANCDVCLEELRTQGKRPAETLKHKECPICRGHITGGRITFI